MLSYREQNWKDWQAAQAEMIRDRAKPVKPQISNRTVWIIGILAVIGILVSLVFMTPSTAMIVAMVWLFTRNDRRR